MKYAIIGSRKFADLALVRRFVLRHLPQNAEIVTGGAAGADKAAEKAAKERGLKTTILEADWSKGAGAGPQRNTAIIAEAEKVVAFWDGKSSGTKDGIEKARKARKPLLIIFEDGTTRREEPQPLPEQGTLW